MKRWTGLVAAIVLYQFSLAQQKPWQPFPFGQVSYFSDTTVFPPTDRKYYYTLSADSQFVNGQDTTFYFNRNLFDGESQCTQLGSLLWEANSYGFRRDSIRVSADTVWFTGEEGWIFNRSFNQTLNISATCDGVLYRYSSAWYDNALQDSVRSVSAFMPDSLTVIADDVIRISKWHGLLSWNVDYDTLKICHGLPVRLRLNGYKNDTNEWGFRPPEVEQYFRYHPGDIVKTFRSYPFPQMGSSYSDRDSIYHVQYTADTLYIEFLRTHVLYLTNGSVDTVFTYNTTASFDIGRYRPTFKRTTGMTSVGFEWETMVAGVSLYSETTPCGMDTFLEIKWDGAILIPDSCALEFLAISNGHRSLYSVKRGFISRCSDGLQSDCLTQTGYYSPVAGYQCGSIFGTGEEEPAIKVNDVVVHPNPASSIIYINFYQPVSGTFEIRDLVGRLVQSKRLERNVVVKTDVTEFLPGFYCIRVQSDGNILTHKFIKQ